jgi:GNAT superfamily N-acetyltransferase
LFGQLRMDWDMIDGMRPTDGTTPDTQPEIPAHSQVTYRVVSDGELQFLAPLFAKLGWPPLDPDYAKAVVAEIGHGPDAIICGFQVVQFVVHSEPMFVEPSMRGTGIAEGLAEATRHYIEKDCRIKRYVSTAKPGSFGARLAEANGMELKPGTALYVKTVKEK